MDEDEEEVFSDAEVSTAHVFIHWLGVLALAAIVLYTVAVLYRESQQPTAFQQEQFSVYEKCVAGAEVVTPDSRSQQYFPSDCDAALGITPPSNP